METKFNKNSLKKIEVGSIGDGVAETDKIRDSTQEHMKNLLDLEEGIHNTIICNLNSKQRRKDIIESLNRFQMKETTSPYYQVTKHILDQFAEYRKSKSLGDKVEEVNKFECNTEEHVKDLLCLKESVKKLMTIGIDESESTKKGEIKEINETQTLDTTLDLEQQPNYQETQKKRLKKKKKVVKNQKQKKKKEVLFDDYVAEVENFSFYPENYVKDLMDLKERVHMLIFYIRELECRKMEEIQEFDRSQVIATTSDYIYKTQHELIKMAKKMYEIPLSEFIAICSTSNDSAEIKILKYNAEEYINDLVDLEKRIQKLIINIREMEYRRKVEIRAFKESQVLDTYLTLDTVSENITPSKPKQKKLSNAILGIPKHHPNSCSIQNNKTKIKQTEVYYTAISFNALRRLFYESYLSTELTIVNDGNVTESTFVYDSTETFYTTENTESTSDHSLVGDVEIEKYNDLPLLSLDEFKELPDSGSDELSDFETATLKAESEEFQDFSSTSSITLQETNCNSNTLGEKQEEESSDSDSDYHLASNMPQVGEYDYCIIKISEVEIQFFK